MPSRVHVQNSNGGQTFEESTSRSRKSSGATALKPRRSASFSNSRALSCPLLLSSYSRKVRLRDCAP